MTTLYRERLKKVADFRLTNPTKSVKAAANTPAIFTQIRQQTTNFLCVPCVTSEGRSYIPIGFMKPDVIVSDRILIIPNANLYMFEILVSQIHNPWVSIIAGRLGTSYSYDSSMYNNFVWPSLNENQRVKIESIEQRILDVRAQFQNSSLADLYDPLTMPEELLKAHKAND